MVHSPSYKDYGTTEFRAGGCVSLSCGAQRDCSRITWLFSDNKGPAVELVVGGKVKTEDDTERLCVTEECSLEVKKLRKKDEGVYFCREYPPADGVDHTRHELKQMTSTSTPTTTTVKANTSTSKPTTTPVKGAASSSTTSRPSTSTPTTHTLNGAASSSTTSRPPTTPTPHTPNGAASSSPTSRPSSTPTSPTPNGAASSSTTSRPPTTPTPHTPNGGSPTAPPSRGLYIGVGVALGTAVLLIVGLVLLIRWLRRRGNKRPKDTTTIDLNSIRDTPPVIGGLHDQHLSVDGDQGGGPTYASIVLPEGQRSVATAQVEDDSSDAVTYSSVRASPRGGEKAGDVDVHYATVNKRRK